MRKNSTGIYLIWNVAIKTYNNNKKEAGVKMIENDDIIETIETKTYEQTNDVKKYVSDLDGTNVLFILIMFISVLTSISASMSKSKDQSVDFKFVDLVGAIVMGATMGIICISLSVYTNIDSLYFVIIAAISGSISTHIFRRLNVNEGYIIFLFANIFLSKLIPEKYSMENYKKAMRSRRKEDREGDN